MGSGGCQAGGGVRGLRSGDGGGGEGEEGQVGLEVETFGESAGGGFVAEELFGGGYGGGWRGGCEPPESGGEEAVGGCHCVVGWMSLWGMS